MRFYSLFIIFLCTSYCFSQQYEVRISDFDFFARTKKKRCGTNEMWLEIELINGSKHRIDGNGGETKKQSYYTPQRYDIPIKSIIFHSFIHGKAGLFCEGASASIDEKIPAKSCLKGFLERHTDGKRYGEPAYLDISFNYEINPVTKLIQTTYEIGYNDYLTLEIDNDSKNLPSELFKYEYILESNRNLNGWDDLPAEYQGRKNPKIRLRDFLPTSVIGDRIKIRTKSSCGGQYRSDFVLYEIKNSLPILKNDNNDVIITNCYGDKADYTLRFDRPLKKGEKMFFNIKGVNVGNPDPFTYGLDSLEKGNTLTFKNLKAGTYAVSYLGNGSANAYTPYTEGHPFIFTIKNPDPVKFFIIKRKNPSCNEGNDGEIYIGAYGGVHNYKIQINNSEWQDFTYPRGTHHIENLSSGKYTIRVKDTNGCIGRDRWNDNKETIIVELKAPEPITISYPPDRQKLPSFNGASDGYITAVIKGGTPLYFGEKKYNFVWENANGDILANTEYNFDSVTGEFSVILRNVREGNYFLSVYDQNYDSNNNKRVNCAKLRSQYYLSHPEKLKASIELSNPISCNSQNEFGDEKDKNPYDGQRDESQDGELKIEASGGTPFTGTQNGGKPYIYTWKKQDNNGNWVTLPIEDDTAKNLSAGKYAINIQDANGIVLGEYNTHTVTKVVDVVYELKEPAKLTLSLQKTDATCKGNDGKITATPVGGTPPYTYLWSNGATTASIENLLPMPYTVEIKDGAGCMVQGSTAVLQPNSLTVTGTVTPLRCHNANNAAIALAVQGGTAPYQYLWNTGATTANINNLPSGEYKVKITDAQGCAHFKTFTIENPSKFEIDLGENRTLCNGQTLTLNIAINDPQATYLWIGDNGFSSNTPQVTLSEKGTYRATVTTKDGCTATDAITIESANTQIASEFLLTTQAYENEEVILVNTSSPKGETTEWLVPENQAIEVTNKNDDYISLIFKAKGEYRIGIKQTQGNCFELFYKNIIVEPATDLPKTQKTNEAFVREFEVAPNPNDGKFKAKVVLEKAGAIKFRLYSITGQLVSEKNSASATEHWVDFQDPLPAATYILVLETPYQRLSKKIIIIP
jgi:putative PKD domain containing protein